MTETNFPNGITSKGISLPEGDTGGILLETGTAALTITDMAAATTLLGPEVTTVVQSGANVKATMTQIGTLVLHGGPANYPAAALGIDLETPEAVGSGDSKTIFQGSGNATSGTSGDWFAGSGDVTTGTSGLVGVQSGGATTGTTGTAALVTGNATAAGGKSGDITIRTGSTVDQVSGNITIQIGLNAGGTSGHLYILNLPTIDPHVAGVAWLNSKVLTVSTG